MDWRDYITTNGGIAGGKPIVKGTRLTVEFIAGRLADGWSEEDVLENYPTLDKEAYKAAFQYYRTVLKRIGYPGIPNQTTIDKSIVLQDNADRVV